MNYNAKRALASRVVYIVLTLMAITILCITLYTFFGSSDLKNPDDSAQVGITEDAGINDPDETAAPVDNRDTDDHEVDVTPSDTQPVINDETDDTPVNNEPEEMTFVIPVEGYVSKNYSPTIVVYSLTMEDYRVHNGIDIEATLAANVCACADGTIKTIYADPFMGNCIIIDHGNEVYSYYKNLGDTFANGIAEGVKVTSGQVIGSIGESAIIEISDSPHLHFEMTVSGKLADPLEYIEYNDEEAIGTVINQE